MEDKILGEKRVISEKLEHELSKIIIEKAKENKMTISNIEEVMEKVIEYFKDNASL